MVTPNWQTASTGSPPKADHVNQFLGSHVSQDLYNGVSIASVTTNGTASTSTYLTYLAQSFTMVGTTVGLVRAPIETTVSTGGSGLTPTTLSLYANSAGAPSGSPIVSTAVTAEYAYLTTANGAVNTRTYYPLPATGLTNGATYWLVLAAAGDPVNNYTWYQSASVSGASTSPDGITWTPQAYGFRYTVFDQTPSGQLFSVWEDGGKRWTFYVYNANTRTMASYSEYTVGQAGYIQSYRTFSYSNGSLSVVS